ncbi:MAG: FkbM family methyltransferase [Azoarcus sp.]|jgi:FkbM family methyltransferase|nr:FkbM family methyltransferase [Azoarcus sp.]
MNKLNEFAALLQTCAHPAQWVSGKYPVLIYGAGNTGWGAMAILKAQGIEIAGFLDAQAKPGQHLAGLPVSTLSDWLSKHDPTHYEVLIAIANPILLPQILELRQQMTVHGFAKCSHDLYKLEFTPLFLKDPVLCRFENTKQYYKHVLPELSRLDALLADEESRQCLMNYVRMHCEERETQYYNATDHYRPSGLPTWPQPLRFIDGGAYTGDTLADFSQHGYLFEAIAAFEPDPENFQRLVSNSTIYENIICFPCALGSETKNVRFDASGTTAAYVTEKGAQSIQCVALDDVLRGFRPNLIKMDIEGAEPEALMGAKDMITRHRPHLAICLYHQLEHLWRIPLLLDEWQLGYRFYLRQHAPVCELVLYAYPDERPGFVQQTSATLGEPCNDGPSQ